MAPQPFAAARSAFLEELKGGLKDALNRKNNAGDKIVQLASMLKATRNTDMRVIVEALSDVRSVRKELASLSGTDEGVVKRLDYLEQTLKDQTNTLAKKLDHVASVFEGQSGSRPVDVRQTTQRTFTDSLGRIRTQNVATGRFERPVNKNEEKNRPDLVLLRSILDYEKKNYELGKRALVVNEARSSRGANDRVINYHFGGQTGSQAESRQSNIGSRGYKGITNNKANRDFGRGNVNPRNLNAITRNALRNIRPTTPPAVPEKGLLENLLGDTGKNILSGAAGGAASTAFGFLRSRALPFLARRAGPAAAMLGLAQAAQSRNILAAPDVSKGGFRAFLETLDPNLAKLADEQPTPAPVPQGASGPNQNLFRGLPALPVNPNRVGGVPVTSLEDAETLKKLADLKKELEDELDEIKRKSPRRNFRNYRADEIQQQLKGITSQIESVQSGGFIGGGGGGSYGGSGRAGGRSGSTPNIPGVTPGLGQTASQAQIDAQQRAEQAKMPAYNPQFSPSTAAGAGSMQLPNADATPNGVTSLPVTFGGGYADPTQFQNPRGNPNVNQDIIANYEKAGKQLPVVIRNNNPAALSLMNPGSGKEFAERQEGYVGATPRPANEGGYYAKFATPEHGIAANAKLLESYGEQGINTPDAIVRKWSTNSSAWGAYSSKLQQALGVSGDTPVDLSNKDIQAKILSAKSAHESGAGKPIYDEETFKRGVNRDFSGGNAGGAPATTAQLPGLPSMPRASMADIGTGMAGDAKGAMFATVDPNATRATGVAGNVAPGDFDKIRGTANLARNGDAGYYGDPTSPDFKKSNLTTVTLDSGKTVEVNKVAAESYRGFLNELEKSGYKIDSLGGYSNRGNVNDPSRLSMHGMGTAIDINPAQNPNQPGQTGPGITNLPANISDMAAKYGISWGGDWKSLKDTMHFEYAGQLADELKKKNIDPTALAQSASPPTQPVAPMIPTGIPVPAAVAANPRSIFSGQTAPADLKSRTLGAMVKAAMDPNGTTAPATVPNNYSRSENGRRNFGFGPDGFMPQGLGTKGYSSIGPINAFGLPAGTQPIVVPEKPAAQAQSQTPKPSAVVNPELEKRRDRDEAASEQRATPPSRRGMMPPLSSPQDLFARNAAKASGGSASPSNEGGGDTDTDSKSAKGSSATPSDAGSQRKATPDPTPAPAAASTPAPVSKNDADTGSGGVTTKAASKGDSGTPTEAESNKKMSEIEMQIGDFGMKSLNTPSYA